MKNRVKASDLSFERTLDGYLLVSAVIENVYRRWRFYGFTKREASKIFRDKFNNGYED